MEIKEVAELKRRLEHDITVAAYALVEDFKEQTGFSPDSISVYLQHVQKLTERKGSTFVSKTSISIEI